MGNGRSTGTKLISMSLKAYIEAIIQVFKFWRNFNVWNERNLTISIDTLLCLTKKYPQNFAYMLSFSLRNWYLQMASIMHMINNNAHTKQYNVCTLISNISRCGHFKINVLRNDELFSNDPLFSIRGQGGHLVFPSARKKKLCRGRWVLTSCQSSVNSLKRFQRRRRKCLS